jgi:antitoxin YefM
LYIIMYYLLMTHTLPISEARKDLTSLVDNVNKKLEEYIITVNGSPAAVLISAAEYESWKETNEIMADSELLQAIKDGEKDIAAGKFITFDQLKKELNLHV